MTRLRELRIAKDPRFTRLPAMRAGSTYADDDFVERVTVHRIYIVATCDKDLKRRLRKIPGVPLISIKERRYQVERMPEAQHCFTTLAHLSSAEHADAATGETFHRSPNGSPSARYASTYAPYALNQCDGMVRPTRYWLVVHSGTARFMRETSDGSVIAVWTDDLTAQGYRGGQVGLFTYANQMSIYNVRVWNLDDDSSRGECSGHGSCDLDRGLCACAAGFAGPRCSVCEAGYYVGVSAKSGGSTCVACPDAGGSGIPYVKSYLNGNGLNLASFSTLVVKVSRSRHHRVTPRASSRRQATP